MKKYGYILMTAVILAGLLVAAPLYGQCPMAGNRGMPSGNIKGVPMPDFDLSAEQEKQMTDLKTAMIKETEPLKTDLKVKGIEFMELWKGDNPDAKKILAKVQEIGGLKLKLQEKMINHKLAMMKILTPEQKTMMKSMMGMGCAEFDCCDIGEKCGMMGGPGCGKSMSCGMHGEKSGEGGCGGCGK